jgi:hypothetical protein
MAGSQHLILCKYAMEGLYFQEESIYFSASARSHQKHNRGGRVKNILRTSEHEVIFEGCMRRLQTAKSPLVRSLLLSKLLENARSPLDWASIYCSYTGDKSKKRVLSVLKFRVSSRMKIFPDSFKEWAWLYDCSEGDLRKYALGQMKRRCQKGFEKYVLLKLQGKSTTIFSERTIKAGERLFEAAALQRVHRRVYLHVA